MSKDTLRMVIGFVFIIAILIIWQSLFRPNPRPAAPQTPPLAETTQAKSAQPPVKKAKPEQEQPVPELTPLLVEPARPETTVVLENQFLKVKFTNMGGALSSVRLKHYKAELVPEGATLLSTDLLLPKGTADLSHTLMQTRSGPHSVTFTITGESLSLKKTFTMDNGYTIKQKVEIKGAKGYVLRAMSGIAITERNIKEDLAHSHFYIRTTDKPRRFAAKNLKKPVNINESADWVALKSKYFFLAAVNKGQGFDSTYAAALEDRRVGFNAAVHTRDSESELTFYIGPLEYTRLHSFGLGFENAVSLGWAKPIALGILWLLKFLYRIFGNWGVAIIIFSILMKLVFYPLTRTQTKQMRQMQMLQPKLNELKKKYKSDPQALNRETMELYKLYKVNPLSGCLPMLIQLPVFWALYSVLRTFIDLRGADFVFWLKDLSKPDTLFGHLPFMGNPAIGLLPIMMGVSFIAQNMLTSADKKNWALTIIFPIFITVIFLNFPSGLQLYWFIYNILSILESLIVLKGGKAWRKMKPGKGPSLATAQLK
ncbi:hypothetical protein CH330_01590 [candidate division WOR-3 bacterium JGI_Cruoil_03_51_56]|uniref:Membrane protein insertase YidC n=1 Tax=candidate division WOR-3 bacterium JGI_Cruoil_03_51_56 TaxID=1973747 RepID=A0A235BXC1_UNCW3|nr:MAG: hypothetical protein CH330_01590 [candidate division WOR-3 bacterium JGI_Cruoil_03_51_56]